MSLFTCFDDFVVVDGSRKLYALNSAIYWEIGAIGSGWELIIPAKTEFDISVPRLLEWVLSPHDQRILPAAAIHDELIKLGLDTPFASAEFRRAAIARGCSNWFAWVLFLTTLVWTSFPRKLKRL